MELTPSLTSLIKCFFEALSEKNIDYAEKGSIAFALYNSYHKLKEFDKAGNFLLLGNKFLDNWIADDINEEEN